MIDPYEWAVQIWPTRPYAMTLPCESRDIAGKTMNRHAGASPRLMRWVGSGWVVWVGDDVRP